MEIKTKLETNQPVFLLIHNKVREALIESISIQVDIHDNVTTVYTIRENPAGNEYTTRFSEDQIHATKELLLDSL